jgi:hypothetical protein
MSDRAETARESGLQMLCHKFCFQPGKEPRSISADLAQGGRCSSAPIKIAWLGESPSDFSDGDKGAFRPFAEIS